MALNAYLKLKGQKLGDIKGSVIQKGREGWIQVIAAHHQVLSPRDTATGQASGKRVHKPFVITKELDKSSPLLYQLLINNEPVECEFRFFAPSATAATGGGVESLRYTVKLANAAISEIAFRLPNTKDPDLQRFAEYEEVSFTYQKIEWTFVDGAITAQDSWIAP